MLAVTRKVGSAIIIDLTDVDLANIKNKRIEVKVLRVEKESVRVGVKADPGIPVNRHEVQARIDAGEPQRRNVVMAEALRNAETGPSND